MGRVGPLDPLRLGGRVGQAGRGGSEVLRPELNGFPQLQGLGASSSPLEGFLTGGNNEWMEPVCRLEAC